MSGRRNNKSDINLIIRDNEKKGFYKFDKNGLFWENIFNKVSIYKSLIDVLNWAFFISVDYIILCKSSRSDI